MPALASDNPYVPDAVRESWKNLPEQEYRRFVLGDWDVADDPDQLIKFEWLHDAKFNVSPITGRNSMGIDVARFGDDMTTFAYYRGNELYEIQDYSGLRLNKTASMAVKEMLARGIGADRVGVDVVGIGAGVADIMIGDGYHVKEIVSGAAAVENIESTYQFRNLRTQMWWAYREALRLGKISMSYHNPKLDDDLLSVHYKMQSDKTIHVETKDEIKKRIGRSTDYGDSAVYGHAAPWIPATSNAPLVVFG